MNLTTLLSLLLAVMLLYPIVEGTIFILIVVIIVMMLFPLIEGAAGSTGTLIQLNTSSASLDNNFFVENVDVPQSGIGGCGLGMCGGVYGGGIRPVMQRGEFYNNPSWSRL